MKGDLISRSRLLEDLGASCYDLNALTGITGDERTLQEAILQLPAEDAERVVHARWITYRIGDSPKKTYRCSNCDVFRGIYTTRFCHSCGARMDAEEVNAYEESRNHQKHGQAPRDPGSS